MPDLPIAAERHIDDVCVRFESALQAETPATIEEYLGDAAEPVRSALLRELLRLEIEYRIKRGEQPTVDEYRVRFPAHATSVANWYPTLGWSAAPESAPAWPDLPAYEFEARLPEGGMAVVFKARH